MLEGRMTADLSNGLGNLEWTEGTPTSIGQAKGLCRDSGKVG